MAVVATTDTGAMPVVQNIDGVDLSAFKAAYDVHTHNLSGSLDNVEITTTFSNLHVENVGYQDVEISYWHGTGHAVDTYNVETPS